MLIKCKYCNSRIRERQIHVHEKSCPKARRLKRLENNKLNTQSIEYRNEVLSQFEFTNEYNLKEMSDIQFNDLAYRLSALKKQREEKENILLEKEKQKAEKIKADELEKEKLESQLKEKKEKEEKDRLEQLEKEQETFKNKSEKSENLKKTFEKGRVKEVVKSEEEQIKDEIKNIDDLVDKSLPKKKTGRKKK